MNQLKMLSEILSQIDEIDLVGITYDGKVIDNEHKYISQSYTPITDYKVPDDFICQFPDQTKSYKVGMCDSIAVLIADECKNVGIPTISFVTNCTGIPIRNSSHCITFCNVDSCWIRGDMSFAFLKANGLNTGLHKTLNDALYDYSLWCKSALHATKGIRLFKYDGCDAKYYGMRFWPMMKNVVQEKNLYWSSQDYNNPVINDSSASVSSIAKKFFGTTDTEHVTSEQGRKIILQSFLPGKEQPLPKGIGFKDIKDSWYRDGNLECPSIEATFQVIMQASFVSMIYHFIRVKVPFERIVYNLVCTYGKAVTLGLVKQVIKELQKHNVNNKLNLGTLINIWEYFKEDWKDIFYFRSKEEIFTLSLFNLGVIF